MISKKAYTTKEIKKLLEEVNSYETNKKNAKKYSFYFFAKSHLLVT